jgi:large subunit ribosomal protein L25
MSQHVIIAEPRTISTKGALNSLRRDGRIPAVMYNRHGKSTPLVLGAKDFAKAVTGVSESTIVQLHVGADSFECLIKERQLDWLRGNIDHVDFFEVEKDVVIRAKVPVHLIGNSIGVREGGILENPVHEIEVECLPKDMPEKFEIDISDLHANHSIHVRDISHASAVKIHSSMDQVVVLVKYAKGEETETETAETPAVAATAAAEPAAKS